MAETKVPKTMGDLYDDGSDHECCQRCGFCKPCGDCKSYGCGHKPPQTNPARDLQAKESANG